MDPVSAVRHEVAVVRVEVRNAVHAQLLIELLEVGRERGRDRLLGRTTNAADACRLLEGWLVALVDGFEISPPTADDGETDR